MQQLLSSEFLSSENGVIPTIGTVYNIFMNNLWNNLLKVFKIYEKILNFKKKYLQKTIIKKFKKTLDFSVRSGIMTMLLVRADKKQCGMV